MASMTFASAALPAGASSRCRSPYGQDLSQDDLPSERQPWRRAGGAARVGADGRLTIRTPPALLHNVPATVEIYKAGAIQHVIQPQANRSWAFRRQAEAFMTDVLDDRPSLNPGVDALEDLRLAEAMWRLELADPPAKS